MAVLTRFKPLFVAPLLVACGGSHEKPEKPAARLSPAPTAVANTDPSFAGPVLTTEAITLEPGGERLLVCQSFPLHNDDWLFVEGVTFNATGVHHSNWFVTPEDAYPGPPGAADCSESGVGVFSNEAPTSGGLMFSQSPEAANETQAFAEGAAIAVAPHSKVMVSYHVLNTSPQPLDVGMSAALRMLPESDVKVRLRSGGGQIGLLAVPPMERSRFYSDCTFADPPTFKAYFMLPHYHQRGVGMRLELLGGARDGEVVWQNEGAIGEALGTQIAPAADFTGATGFRFSCLYENTTARTIQSGSSFDDEMCTFFLSTDASREFYGIAAPGFGSPTIVDQGMGAEGEHLFAVDGCAVLMGAEAGN